MYINQICINFLTGVLWYGKAKFHFYVEASGGVLKVAGVEDVVVVMRYKTI